MVFYRLSPFAVALVSVIGFYLSINDIVAPVVVMTVAVFLCAFIIARLLQWQWRTFQFWHLLGTPILFLFSSFSSFLLLETQLFRLLLAIFTIAIFWLFVEQIFVFIHFPVRYKPFTLEHLSQAIHVLSIFFFSTFGFGLLLFLHVKLWLLCLIFFPILFFIMHSTLWASKIDGRRAREYALSGAILMTELFAAISFLPTGFYTNAAFLALGVYILLGLSRADAMRKLSKEVVLRYVLLFVALVSVVAATSQWM